jgi:DNA-binding XRE family transcriptional regulator
VWKLIRGVIGIASKPSPNANFFTSARAESRADCSWCCGSKFPVRAGISQEEFAHRSAIDRSCMSRIERGSQDPGIVSVLRIASALKMIAAARFAKALL